MSQPRRIVAIFRLLQMRSPIARAISYDLERQWVWQYTHKHLGT
ncbi:MAG: hypothetical protein RM368_34280 [Nostoc sp. DedSLP03]|nr:hypothetical protein [Nostoc sp. C057]MDZ7969952.1 hypothetical protein [Nostoc sp. DedSLP03]